MSTSSLLPCSQDLGQDRSSIYYSDSDQDRLFHQHWYAIRTQSNQEKAVSQRLAYEGVDHFLPLYEDERQWKDGRKRKIEVPLFSGYLFVSIQLSARANVLRIPGIAYFVSCGRFPVIMPEADILAMQQGLLALKARPYDLPRRAFELGTWVRVKAGPMTGWIGILTQYKGKSRVIMTVDLIQRSIVVEMDETSLEEFQGPIVTRTILAAKAAGIDLRSKI
jgi:transcription antitermination factor NusG